jgi:hypothetical protein
MLKQVYSHFHQGGGERGKDIPGSVVQDIV